MPARAASFLSFLLLASTAYAEQNMLDYLAPRGGSRGTTVEVEIHGRELKDAREVLFYQPGLKAIGITPGAKPAESVKVKIQIAPNCAIRRGNAARVRTATSLSDAATFWVSPYPQVAGRSGEEDRRKRHHPEGAANPDQLHRRGPDPAG